MFSAWDVSSGMFLVSGLDLYGRRIAWVEVLMYLVVIITWVRSDVSGGADVPLSGHYCLVSLF